MDVQALFFVVVGHLELNLALACELFCIFDQIYENLLQAALVSNQDSRQILPIFSILKIEVLEQNGYLVEFVLDSLQLLRSFYLQTQLRFRAKHHRLEHVDDEREQLLRLERALL